MLGLCCFIARGAFTSSFDPKPLSNFTSSVLTPPTKTRRLSPADRHRISARGLNLDPETPTARSLTRLDQLSVPVGDRPPTRPGGGGVVASVQAVWQVYHPPHCDKQNVHASPPWASRTLRRARRSRQRRCSDKAVRLPSTTVKRWGREYCRSAERWQCKGHKQMLEIR